MSDQPEVEQMALMQEMLNAFKTVRPELQMDERVKILIEEYKEKYPTYAPLLSNIKLLEWNPSYAILVDSVHGVMFTIASNPISNSSQLQKAAVSRDLFKIREKYLTWKATLPSDVKSLGSGQGLGGAVIAALSDLEKDMTAHSFHPSGPGLVNPEKRSAVLQAANVSEEPPNVSVFESSDPAVSHTYASPRPDQVIILPVLDPADSLKDLLPPVTTDYPDVPKQVYALVECPDLKSVSIDSASGLLRLETTEGPLRFDEQFLGADIATVFYFVYAYPELCVFSLDPADARNPDGKYLRKVFYPQELAGTVLGQALWRADWKLKQLDQGAWFDDSLNTRIPISDFRSGIDFAKSTIPVQGVDYWRLWFVIDKVEFVKAESASGVTLECKSVKIRVEARTLAPDASKPSGFSDVPTPVDANCSQFSRYLTDHFEEICQKVPEIKRLKQMAIIKGFAEWVRDMLLVPKEMMCLEKLKDMMPRVPDDYPIDKVPKITNSVSEPFKGMIKRLVISGGIEMTKAEVITLESEDLVPIHVKEMKKLSAFSASHEQLLEWLLDPETAPSSDEEDDRSGYFQLFSPKKCSFPDCPKIVQFQPSRHSSSLSLASKSPVTAYSFQGQVFCAAHHPRRCCAVSCKKPDPIIVANQPFLEVANMMFHQGCFRCYICDAEFEGGTCSKDAIGFCHRLCAEKKLTSGAIPQGTEEEKVEEPQKSAGKKGGKAGPGKPGKSAGLKKSGGIKKSGTKK